MTRSIRAIVQDVIDNTDAADIGTQVAANALTDEVCRALETEGYMTVERPSGTIRPDVSKDMHCGY